MSDAKGFDLVGARLEIGGRVGDHHAVNRLRAAPSCRRRRPGPRSERPMRRRPPAKPASAAMTRTRLAQRIGDFTAARRLLRRGARFRRSASLGSPPRAQDQPIDTDCGHPLDVDRRYPPAGRSRSPGADGAGFRPELGCRVASDDGSHLQGVVHRQPAVAVAGYPTHAAWPSPPMCSGGPPACAGLGSNITSSKSKNLP